MVLSVRVNTSSSLPSRFDRNDTLGISEPLSMMNYFSNRTMKTKSAIENYQQSYSYEDTKNHCTHSCINYRLVIATAAWVGRYI